MRHEKEYEESKFKNTYSIHKLFYITLAVEKAA